MPGTGTNDAITELMKVLSERDHVLLFCVFLCSTNSEIDYDRLQKFLGMTNIRSAQNAVTILKKKLRDTNGYHDIPPATTTADDMTPKKPSKKAKNGTFTKEAPANDSAVDDAADDVKPEPGPTPEPTVPKKRGPGRPKKLKTESSFTPINQPADANGDDEATPKAPVTRKRKGANSEAKEGPKKRGRAVKAQVTVEEAAGKEDGADEANGGASNEEVA